MKTRSKMLKGAIAVTCLLTAMLTWGEATASVIDAPHNESNGVGCGSCHTYSLWWQYSPAVSSASPGYAVISDAVCNKCHGPSGSEFRKVSHSSASMGDAHNVDLGTWSTKCVDCHNPHLQAQLDWLPANPTFGDGSMGGGLYLVEGTVSGISDNGNGTTDITFTNAAAKSPWEDPLRWNKKSGNVDRGLILSLRYKVGNEVFGQTYEIVDATASVAVSNASPGVGEGTITIQTGNAPVPTEYNNTNFGIIYGQLINSTINTPNSGAKSVEFFDSQDGFTDSGATTPKAICQVCHTQTTYWRNDGSLNIHNVGTTCTSCHPVAAGFKPNYPDHNDFIAKNTSCGTCHTGAQVVENIHKFNCNTCHAASGPPALKEANPSTPFRQTPAAWTPLNSPPASGDCAECHGADYFDHHQKKNDHSGQVNKAVLNCTAACHFHNKPDTIVDIHKNQCSHCHDLLNGGVKISLAAQYGPGDCTNCHREIAEDPSLHPKATNHVGQVDRAPTCLNTTGCHPGNTITMVHKYNCGSCHELTYLGLRTDFNTAKAFAITPGNCVACHQQTDSDGHNIPAP